MFTLSHSRSSGTAEYFCCVCLSGDDPMIFEKFNRKKGDLVGVLNPARIYSQMVYKTTINLTIFNLMIEDVKAEPFKILRISDRKNTVRIDFLHSQR